MMSSGSPESTRHADAGCGAAHDTRSRRERVMEAGTVGALGVILGAATGRLTGWRTVGSLAGATVGGLNGLISGWRGIYPWHTGRGRLMLVADSTWALGSTASGLGSHGVAAAQRLTGRDPGYVPGLSLRQGRHVYRRGFRLRRGFVVTMGSVISGAGDLSSPRQVRLVTDHEQVHVTQARVLGPLYPLVYLGWMAGAAVVAPVIWVRARAQGRDVALPAVMETCAYYCNPCEWWAYSRDANWPPSGKLPGLGWTRPIVRPATQSPTAPQ